MQINKNFISELNLLQGLIILNFFLYFVEINKLIIKINFLIIIFIFIYLIFFKLKKNLFYSKITLIFLSIISLGSPLISMDARGIWMFKAKRIYYDNNIFATFDNYLGMFQNDYPAMVASLSSTIAIFIGGWNEIFPKFSCLIFFVSPFLYLSFVLKNKFKQMFFSILILLILEKRIIIGEMDALISIYFIAVAFGLAEFIIKTSKLNNKQTSKPEIVFLVFNLIILSFIKVEAIGVICILYISVFLLMIIKKESLSTFFNFFLLITIAIIPWIFWKYLTKDYSIDATVDTWFQYDEIFKRVFEFNLYPKILHLILFNTHSIIALIMITFVIAKISWLNLSISKLKKNLNSDVVLNASVVILFSSILYLMLIFFGYLFSTYLYESVLDVGKNFGRYSMPISLSIGYLSILIYNNLDSSFKLSKPTKS